MATEKEIRDFNNWVDSLPSHKETIESICREQGYGAVMQQVARLWEAHCRFGNLARGSNKLVGTCAALAVDCGCETEPHCKWCGGCGWLTPHVKALKVESILDAALKKGK